MCLQVVRLRPEWLCGCDGVHTRSHWFWIPWWSVQGRKAWESSLLKSTGVDRCITKPLRLSYIIYVVCGANLSISSSMYVAIHVSIYPSIYSLCQFIRLSIYSSPNSIWNSTTAMQNNHRIIFQRPCFPVPSIPPTIYPSIPLFVFAKCSYMICS